MSRPTLLACAALFAAYVGSGWLGLQLPPYVGNFTLIWLPGGVAVHFLLRHGFACAPGLVAGSLALTALPAPDWRVGLGVALVGTGAAVAVTLFQFPGRRAFELALLLPLAMPAYVLAYVYTDTLQSSGPLQIWLREATGARGALWPDVRSLPAMVPAVGSPLCEGASPARWGWPTPITSTRRAPTWMAGDSGDSWRMEPSPKCSRCPSTHSGTDGNRNGMALEAIRCSMVIGWNSARRPGRRHGLSVQRLAVWQKVQCSPVV